MQGKTHLAFIIHGKVAAKGKLVTKVKVIIEELGSVAFQVTTAEKNLNFCTTEAIGEGANILIAMGGDGTVDEVANAILFHPNRNTLKMGILPFGKGNDFVRSLGIGRDSALIRDNINLGKSRLIDVGKLDFIDKNGIKSQRYFVNIADVGLGGMATQMLRAGRHCGVETLPISGSL